MEQIHTLPFTTQVVAGDQAYDTLIALRNQHADLVPVVLGDDAELEALLEVVADEERSQQEILDQAEQIQVLEWVEQRYQEYQEMMAEFADEFEDEDNEDELDADAEADFEAEEAADETDLSPRLSTIAYDILSGEAKEKVHIGLLPLAQAWQVPAFLKIGNWNECPDAAVHVAFFKYWYEQYGAVVTAISGDTIEFSVARPPETIEQARILAHQQYMYCADIVDQGVETEENLAHTLLNADNWFFWWD